MAVMSKKMEKWMQDAMFKAAAQATQKWTVQQPRMSGKSSMGTHIHALASVQIPWVLSLEDPDDVETEGSQGWYWKWGWDDASKGRKSALTEITLDSFKMDAYQQGYDDGLDYVAVREQLENGVADRT